MPTIEDEDPHPFDSVHITPLFDAQGLPTLNWEVLGLRQGGERSARVTCQQLIEQAETHLQWGHGKGEGDPITEQEWNHALMHAAVAFLID